MPRNLLVLPVLAAFALGLLALPNISHAAAPIEQGEVLSKEGSVDWTGAETNWVAATVGQKLKVRDRVRTRALSRAMLRLADLGRLRMDELTTLEILPPLQSNSKATLDLKAGAMYFFTRDRPREFLIQTPHALAASRGTEFVVTIDPAGRTVFRVFDGEVELTNTLGSVVIASGEEGVAAPGQPPRKTAVVQANRMVQWWLYYPAVADPDEFALTATERADLAASLSAYRAGDLLAAVAAYPSGRTPATDGERVYLAALLLAVGRVDEAQLSQVTNSPVARALHEMIASVSLQAPADRPPPASASEWVARSYTAQAEFDLKEALAAARRAVERSPQFGFGWERVAELEFSFGRTGKAEDALAKALTFSPRNAQALALKGFLEAANRRWRTANAAFEQAIEVDGALGNARLGRGLLRLRHGDTLGGRADLQTAAALEPNRSLLRSYLGKAFDNADGAEAAQRELALARGLDASDPTPWLYSALVLRQQLRFNEAVSDLEKSAELNDNRRVYRSRLLLDEDRAVRSASLATIYRDAGMPEVSVREASRAVAADYANYSAHLFLAESFDALRDPTRFNLRWETPWFNELLLANLLSPVGGGNLSQNISQQEYSRLFEGNRLGLSSDFEGRSDGQYRELASQFGTMGDFSYALDLDYQHNDGVRPNNELDRLEWYSTLKLQLTPQDSLLALIKYQDYRSGDNFQYYDPAGVDNSLQSFGITNAPVIRTNFTFEEFQHPIAVFGYHHEWAPNVHTLLLGGRLENDQRFSDSNVGELVLSRDTNQAVAAVNTVPMDVRYRSVFEIYTAELNQIFKVEHHTLVLGGRYQWGTIETTNLLTLGSTVDPGFAPFFNDPPAGGTLEDDFERISGYGYYTLEPFDGLHLTGGAAYDRITYPTGQRSPPISAGSATRDQVSPKAALVWSPAQEVAIRAAYSRSLGGFSFDESFRLEPAQLAGFNQSFRSIISESVVGSVSVPKYETIGAALDLKFKSKTYIGVQGEILNSEVSRSTGIFDFTGAIPPPPPVTPGSTREQLKYEEYDVTAGINQLVGPSLSLGAVYGFTRSKLHTVFPEIPVAVSPAADRHERADLHRAMVYALFNHRSGLFARAEGQWYHQDNTGYAPAEPGDDFFMVNLFAGYRFRRQRAELSFGVLNVAGTDYKLNPLNPYYEMPRERVFVGRLKVNF